MDPALWRLQGPSPRAPLFHRCCSYIGQVDYSTTPEELVSLFSAAGAVERITIPGYPWAPQGYAYLEFRISSSAEAAVAQLDGADFKGRALKVQCTREHQRRRRVEPIIHSMYI